MGEPKKKPGRSRKNGTDWELRRYVMLLAAVIVNKIRKKQSFPLLPYLAPAFMTSYFIT